MRKILLKVDVYTKLEDQAKIKGLTTDQLASQIILRKSMTCHDCGLESVDDCVQGKHIPADPTKFPCDYCLRNPEVKRRREIAKKVGKIKLIKLFVREDRDRWNECWTLNENNLPFIER